MVIHTRTYILSHTHTHTHTHTGGAAGVAAASTGVNPTSQSNSKGLATYATGIVYGLQPDALFVVCACVLKSVCVCACTCACVCVRVCACISWRVSACVFVHVFIHKSEQSCLLTYNLT